jgi:hypothetical protein
MTDLKEMLRALAASMPANPELAQQVVASGRRRQRRVRLLAAATGVLLVSAAATVGIRTATTSQPPAAPAIVTASPVAPTSAPTHRPGPAPQRITFGSLTFTLPPGWTISEHESAGPTTNPVTGERMPAHESMCIRPAKVSFGGLCPGLQFDRGWIPGAEGRTFTPHQPDGFLESTGVSPCPVGDPDNGPGGFNGIRTDPPEPVETGFRPVGDRTAVFDRWSAHCDSGLILIPRSWYLPQSMIRILEIAPHPETTALLADVTFR